MQPAEKGENIPFAVPDITTAEVSAVGEAVRSGWITSGGVMREFEKDFATFVGSQVQAVAVNSATAGLHLSLEALGIGPNDEVIVPTWTFTATAEVVRYLGATPVLADVDAQTLNLDPGSVAELTTERTRAVVPVHFAGLPVDLVELRNVVGAGIKIVEDAAHAIPARGSSGLVGNCRIADAAVFSFYATKPITAGEGGMITTRSPHLADRTRVMRLHGIDRDAFNRYQSPRPAWDYDVVAPGFKYNLGDVAAAMGRVQLTRACEMQLRRQAIAEYYLEELKDLPLRLPATGEPDALHAWHLFVIRLTDHSPLNRDEFISALSSQGIGTSVHFKPLHEHSFWRDYAPNASQHLPVACEESHRAVSLPIFSAMSEEQVERVAAMVRQVLS